MLVLAHAPSPGRDRVNSRQLFPGSAGSRQRPGDAGDAVSGETVELGNTIMTAIATPGHAPAHFAYAVADLRRGDEEPWLMLSGDSLLIA